MNRLELLLLPGLDASTLRSSMPWLRAKPWRPLRLAFPPLPASLQATLAQGIPPSAHGVFDMPDEDGTWESGLPSASPASGLLRTRDDRFALVTPGERRREAAVLDGALMAAHEGDSEYGLLIVGGPVITDGARQLDPAELLPADMPYRTAGALLFAGGPLDSRARSRALLSEGIERVLYGESLERRGCAHPGAGETVLVARRGWSFDSQPVCFGREDEDPGRTAFVAACGAALESRAKRWPNAIHDLRIAPTVASLLGRPTDEFAEKPL